MIEGHRKAAAIDAIDYVETSAKEGTGIVDLFMKIATDALVTQELEARPMDSMPRPTGPEKSRCC
jgi:translation initiation factor IF-2